MQALLGLVFFSGILSIGASLECETCKSGQSCTGEVVICDDDQDTCATIWREITIGGQTNNFTEKGCNVKAICDSRGHYEGKGVTKIIKIECSQSAASSASLPLALRLLVGLLLMTAFP
ncbi:phospholipase A2 inhibitor gamma subunit B-like [Hemicordylus capensis]|uniref:phospholipase A2 inhibitor gamma subunit B-like n=1 Tax=Hemicordylus capensis TaxID=884348 RepID=UPI002303EBA8|nr:phospholipase A2 inhibitor gamma subunit B-like [Hemicordylus capensis]